MDPGLDRIRFVSAWQEAQEAEGLQFGPALLALRTESWRPVMNNDPRFRGWGTLRFVTEEIRKLLYHSPDVGRERAAIVVDYVDGVDVPDPVCRASLQGNARKQYAQALRLTGELRKALKEAKRSQACFDSIGGLANETAKARLVEAQVRHELDQHDAALRIARECASTFRDFEDPESYVFARMTEAWILFGGKQFKKAAEIFHETTADAERRGDKHTVASCIHNTAECARELGDIPTARRLYARSVKLFDEVGTAIQRPRARWAYGLSLGDEGSINEAISEIHTASNEFLTLGMNGDAATASLDIVRLKFARGDDVTDMCALLVRIFTEAGMTQNAIEALAYLREQSKQGAVAERKILHVQDFLRGLQKSPAQVFLRPPDDEEDER